MALQDQIDKLNTDLTALAAEVQNAIKDIAALKALPGITPAQSTAIDTITGNLEAATAALKAGE